VKLDGTPWSDAVGGQPLSGLTWVIWRDDWMVEPGSRTFAIRGVDGLGQPQVEQEQPPAPDGAICIFSLKKRI
jgi:hypothetical protein